MGKGKKKGPKTTLEAEKKAQKIKPFPGKVAPEPTRTPDGCNVPYLKHGCLIGKAIPAGAAKLPLGAVRMACKNPECPAVPWIHEECYEQLVDLLSDECLRSHSRCKKWSKRFAVENLWKQGRGYDLVVNLLKCPGDGCTGFLRRDDNFDPIGKPSDLTKQDAPKPTPKPKPGEGDVAGPSSTPQTKTELKKNRADLTKMLKPNGANMPNRVKGSSASGLIAFIDKDKNFQRKKVAAGLIESEKEKFIPVGAPGWTRNREDENFELVKERPSTPPPRSSFPVLATQAPAPRPSVDSGTWGFAAAAELAPGIDVSPEGAKLITELSTIAHMEGGAVWERDIKVTDTTRQISGELMEQIANFGGFETWLRMLDAPIQIQNGRIIVPGMVKMKHPLRSVGIVQDSVDPSDPGCPDVVVYCEAYGTKLLFDRSSVLTDGEGRTLNLRLCPGDWIQFTAEMVAEADTVCESLSIAWKIREAELVQKAEVVETPVPSRRVTSPPLATSSFDYGAQAADAPPSPAKAESEQSWHFEPSPPSSPATQTPFLPPAQPKTPLRQAQVYGDQERQNILDLLQQPIKSPTYHPNPMSPKPVQSPTEEVKPSSRPRQARFARPPLEASRMVAEARAAAHQRIALPPRGPYAVPSGHHTARFPSPVAPALAHRTYAAGFGAPAQQSFPLFPTAAAPAVARVQPGSAAPHDSLSPSPTHGKPLFPYDGM